MADVCEAPADTERTPAEEALTAAEEPVTCFEDLACCEVCHEGDWDDDNAIIFCDSCDLAVHQVCYGAGARKIPEGDKPWFCDLCRQTGKRRSAPPCDKQCILCPVRGGALKRTSDSRWAHIMCALWVPGAHFLDVEGRDVIHPFSINEKRLDLVCSICDVRMGACIQCKAPRCLTAFHVTCARHKGLHMVTKEKDEWVEFAAYCERHRPSTLHKKKRRRRESKW